MQAQRVRDLFAQAAASLPGRPPLEPDPRLLALVEQHAKTIGAAHDQGDAAKAAIAALETN